MSGRQFVETLRQLGYPKASSLDPQGFDWMFENDSVLPFLEWFCNNISSANVLDPKEIDQYNALVESKEGILDGRQLEEALKNFTSEDDDSVTEEMLKKDIEQLNKDMHLYKKRKQALIQKRNKLSVHHTALSHRRSKLTSIESKVKSRYKKCLEQSQTDNTQINSSIDKLVQSVGRLSTLYDVPQPSTERDGDLAPVPMFLSQMSLDDYSNMEEKFTKELTSFTRKQFFEGIAEMAGQEEGSQYEFLEVSDPDSLLVRGETEEVNMAECKELARIQAFYPKSESERINSVLNSKQAGRCFNRAEEILQSIQSGEFGQDINKISQTLHEKLSTLQTVRKDVVNLSEGEVPALIRESTSSQVSRILTGDYNLKLARQDYFVSNQDQVIQQLVLQRSRNEFLTMAFEVEARGHRDLHRLLTAVRQQLQFQLNSWKDRMAVMEDPALSAAKHQRGTVDSRDKFTTRLHHMLVDSDYTERNKHLFLTYSSLVEGAEKLQHRQVAMEDNLLTARTKQEDRVNLLEHNLNTCEEMVYAGSSTTSGQPCLTPRQLMESIMQLDDMLKKLEQAIKDIVKVVDTKKQALRGDPLLNEERKLFTYFFTNSPKLNQLFDEISSRLQAQKVQ